MRQIRRCHFGNKNAGRSCFHRRRAQAAQRSREQSSGLHSLPSYFSYVSSWSLFDFRICRPAYLPHHTDLVTPIPSAVATLLALGEKFIPPSQTKRHQIVDSLHRFRRAVLLKIFFKIVLHLRGSPRCFRRCMVHRSFSRRRIPLRAVCWTRLILVYLIVMPNSHSRRGDQNRCCLHLR